MNNVPSYVSVTYLNLCTIFLFLFDLNFTEEDDKTLKALGEVIISF